MDFLFNPWVISIAAMSLIIGNLAALKYLSKIKFQPMSKKKDFEKLSELDKKLQSMTAKLDSSEPAPSEQETEKKEQAKKERDTDH
ncbi:DUF2897 family protein [Vibrio metschnikovii]|uniref:DUF2897 family protein n=1 Tax=Vibrio metschnikovii TaxID=28172 RepID=UPI001C2F2FA2|nr:DUF2897 family protein [Vibrio metschnikovii]